MEQQEIKTLLEKYWQADTTLEEEKALADYFARPDIDPSFESCRELFAWRAEEANLTAGDDFDRRILERIGSIGQAAQPALPAYSASSASLRALRRSISYAAAAAVFLCIGISLFLMTSGPRSTTPGGRDKTAPSAASAQATAATKKPGTAAPAMPRSAQIKDTYTDPKQALAAVRHALLIASARINEGQNITQQNITRLHKNWQAATGD